MSDLTISIDPGGLAVAARPIMTGFGASAPNIGGVEVSSTTETIISPVAPVGDNLISFFGLLQRLEAICTAAGAGAFDFDLKSVGFNAVMRRIKVAAAPAIGDRIAVEFPTPLRSGGKILNLIAPGTSAQSPNATTAIVVTTAAPHGLRQGDQVTISGVAVNASANGTFTVANVGTSTFSLFTSLNPLTPVIDTAAGTGGIVTLPRPSPGTGQFSIVASAAPGTWFFTVNGFYVSFPTPIPYQSSDG